MAVGIDKGRRVPDRLSSLGKSFFSLAGTKMAVVPSALRMNQAYVVFYVTWAWAFFTCRYFIYINIVHVIFIGFLPMMVLSMLNIKVYMTMQMMRQRLEAKRMNRDDGRFSNN